MTAQPVPGVTLKTAKANNIHMRYAEIGSGPLVLFCHGWPESWYSWRHQLTAVSAAGFRCVAPDMRGYGGTEAPEPIDQYTLHHLVGDMAELVKALSEKDGGETKATIVGHDWGAPVAWHAALWRPDLFPAVCAMSVPYAPPGYVDILSALEKLGINDFYLQYFQKPGVPEAELQQDIRSALRRLYFTAGGQLEEKGKGFARLTGSTTTRRSSRAPAFAAGSTGIATSGATGSWAARGAASRSANLRSSLPAAATACCAFPPPSHSSTPTPRRCPACVAATSSTAPATGCSRRRRPRSTNC
jgi:pimeloyl-ACP methyl ester carboxylesterase